MSTDATKKDSPQRRGGLARRESLSPNERRRAARQAAIARWKQVGDVPEASHHGVLEIGDRQLEVYVLEDGRRLFHKRVMGHALGLKSEGGNAFMKMISGQKIRSEIPADLADKLAKPVVFRGFTGDPVHGYEASVLIEVCEALIRVRDSDSLTKRQMFLAVQAEFLLRAAAKLGITALIDEATGYSDNKRKDEYRQLFQEFLRDEFAQWEQDEYPDRFFDMIYKLYGLKRKNPDSTKHPRFFAKFIRKYIYYPLANSHGAILEQLDQKNPTVYTNGGRRYKMYQFLSEKVGLPALRAHLWQTIGIGAVVSDNESFDKLFYKAFPEAIPAPRNAAQLRFDGI
ncbi:MAG: P63C domain-containing protein [Bauldia sp.]